MNRLAKIRGSKGIDASTFCKMIGISHPSLSYNEKNKIAVKIAKKSAEALNVNVFEILGDEVLRLKPTTQEEKEIVIRIISEL